MHDIEEILTDSFDSCYYYATFQTDRFIQSTDGPRHRKLVEWVMHYKHTNSIIREKIVARALGLAHNPRLHSSYNGITTYDATDTDTNIHYEIKTEQHNTTGTLRKFAKCQINGSGAFGNLSTQADIDNLLKNNPVIAHGLFIDGRLCGIATFNLKDIPSAVGRITRYTLTNSKTTPKYQFADWCSHPGTKIKYFSQNWPTTVAARYRAVFSSAVEK